MSNFDPTDQDRLNEQLIEMRVIQSNFDNLSSRFDKLCDQIEGKVCSQIDENFLLLEKINMRMQEEIVHRVSSEKMLSKLSDDILHLTFLQKNNEKKIMQHEEDISRLKDSDKEYRTAQKTTIAGIKILGKAIAATVSFCFACGGAIYAYLEATKADRETKLAIVSQEMEEKKKKLEYNRERYLIRKGIKYDGQ